jgi:hypothetical protein
VEWNPVKAGLVHDPREFAFSSASSLNAERLRLGDPQSGSSADPDAGQEPCAPQMVK